MNDEKLQFPAHIAKEIGLGVNELAALRRLGCPFYGKKPRVRWVRVFLDRTSGAEAFRLGQSSRLPRAHP